MKILGSLSVFLLAGLVSNLALAESVLLEREIPYGKEVFIPESLGIQCNLGREFSEHLSSSIKASGLTVQFADESLREKAAVANKVAEGDPKRARVDVRIADIELRAAEEELRNAGTEQEKAEARFLMEDARVKKASAEIILAKANGGATSAMDSGKYLFVEINKMDTQTVGGFGTAGAQNRTGTHVVGEYWDGDTKIARFVGKRADWGGLRGGAKGACNKLGRTLELLAKDIGAWMQSPVDGAGLGEFSGCAMRKKANAC